LNTGNRTIQMSAILFFVFSLLSICNAINISWQSQCLWQLNSNPGQFGSACNTATGTSPSSECGYNYVCGTDSTICVANTTSGTGAQYTQNVCTTYAQNTNSSKGMSGYPCNAATGTGCGGPFSCMNTALTATQTDLSKNYTFSTSTWTQSVLGVSISDVANPSNSYTGVCAAAPPSKLIQGFNYPGGSVCAAHTDCRYQVWSSGAAVSGNNVATGGNYLCSSSSGTCAQTASCHPVSHLCETGQSSYFNSACSTCLLCVPNSQTIPCTSNGLPNYVTCSKGSQNVSVCTGTYAGCCS